MPLLVFTLISSLQELQEDKVQGHWIKMYVEICHDDLFSVVKDPNKKLFLNMCYRMNCSYEWCVNTAYYQVLKSMWGFLGGVCSFLSLKSKFLNCLVSDMELLPGMSNRWWLVRIRELQKRWQDCSVFGLLHRLRTGFSLVLHTEGILISLNSASVN